MKNDPMSDRFKAYESVETERILDPNKPFVVRLDGRAFHTLTRGMEKPFDSKFINAMDDVAWELFHEFHPKFLYVQSDEITLVFYYEAPSQPIFGGKIFKITSVLAGQASAAFSIFMSRLASFDCRVFSVPDLHEAANAVLWRWFDAKRNSIGALAHHVFGPAKLHGVNTNQKLAMLEEAGHPWEDLSFREKYGAFITSNTEVRSSKETYTSIRYLNPERFLEATNRHEIILGAAPTYECYV